MSATQAAALPALRDELVLQAGAPAEDGAPTWTLHDPPANRFFQIGWPAFEMLSRWSLGDADRIAAAVNAETTLQLDGEDVQALAGFLLSNHLVASRGAQARERLATARDMLYPGWFRQLLTSYLFFRVPLLRPQAILEWMYPSIRWLYARAVAYALVILALVGFYLAARNIDSLLSTFPHFWSVEGAIWLAVSIAAAKVLHEFGHAFTAYRYGCQVSTMGIAFMVLWPVLYTDTNHAWTLTSARQRLAIGAAGMVTELGLAVIALFAWSVLPDGPWKSAAFLLATTTWIMTLAVNLNPFMRFDGYFLMSDWFGIENLHERSFALGRWWLREFLFALGEPPPEAATPSRRRLMVGFAFGVWLYRLILFLGIALLVYHFFFKLLGIVLMLVELVWFIGRPVWRELREWSRRSGHIRMNFALLRTLTLMTVAAGALLMPWRWEVAVPGLIQAERYAALEAPSEGQIAAILAAPGDPVEPESPVIRLASPDLEFEIARATRELQLLNWQSEVQSVDDELSQQRLILRQQLQEAEQALAALLDTARDMELKAGVTGIVTAVAEPLAVGDWVARGEPLAFVADTAQPAISVYIYEEDIHRVRTGATARFYADDVDIPSIECHIGEVESTSVVELESPLLASAYGGPVAAAADGQGRLIPTRSVFRAALRGCAAFAPPNRVLTGIAQIHGEPQSLAERLWSTAYGVLLRESGF
ncbi:MAG: HlyD family efflux transporter periplasmic adaptor subunit [Pseudomonadota bacterium]